jgi:hypothetical protein
MYELTLYSWALLGKPIVVQLLNFPTFYETQRFSIMFTRALHWSLSWAISIQSIPPHPNTLRSILIWSTHLYLGLLNGLFPYGLCTCLFSSFSCPTPIRATCPAHVILFESNILYYSWQIVKVMKLLLMQFIQKIKNKCMMLW